MDSTFTSPPTAASTGAPSVDYATALQNLNSGGLQGSDLSNAQGAAERRVCKDGGGSDYIGRPAQQSSTARHCTFHKHSYGDDRRREHHGCCRVRQ